MKDEKSRIIQKGYNLKYKKSRIIHQGQKKHHGYNIKDITKI